MNTKQYLLGVMIIALSSLASGVFAQGVSVDKGRLFFSGAPGEKNIQEIVLSNPTNEKVLFQLSFSDWIRDEYGNKLYSDPSTLKHSCSSWISVNATSIELPPMGQKTITVEMATPNNITANDGVFNSMLFIRQISNPYARVETGSNLQSSIDVAFQVGVHVYYIHPSLQKKELAIKGFESGDQDASSASNVVIKLENTGETIVTGYVKLELTHTESGQEYRLFNEQPVSAAFMPDDVRNVTLDLPQDLPSGSYSALAIVDIGASYDLQMAVIDIKVP